MLEINRECRVCGVAFRRPVEAGIPDGYCASCWKASLAFLKLQDDLGDAFSVRLWDEGEERIDRIAQSDGSGAHYANCSEIPNGSRSKYHREIKPGVWVDVYDVLLAFGVTNPADQHGIKKMLMPGQRGAKNAIQDRREAIASLERAIELEGEA